MFVFDSRMAIVRPNLLLGAAAHENDYALLREAGVTHILQVGSELRPSFHGRFQYLRIPLEDAEQQDIISVLPRCFAFIQEAHRQAAGNPDGDDSAVPQPQPPPPSLPQPVVLVHCQAGMSRSASVVLAYLMWAERLPYGTALQQVKGVRPCVYPNMGFLLQLWEWEAGGCQLGCWPGWNKGRFAERLAQYRRAQAHAGLHPAVRVPLPLLPLEQLEPAGAAATAAPAVPVAHPIRTPAAPAAVTTPAAPGTPMAPTPAPAGGMGSNTSTSNTSTSSASSICGGVGVRGRLRRNGVSLGGVVAVGPGVMVGPGVSAAATIISTTTAAAGRAAVSCAAATASGAVGRQG
ncbi:hypothetical protein Agub_g11914, partial [Astrephomene gubernaculifera]